MLPTTLWIVGSSLNERCNGTCFGSTELKRWWAVNMTKGCHHRSWQFLADQSAVKMCVTPLTFSALSLTFHMLHQIGWARLWTSHRRANGGVRIVDLTSDYRAQATHVAWSSRRMWIFDSDAMTYGPCTALHGFHCNFPFACLWCRWLLRC